MRNLPRQNKQGRKDKAALTPTVRRDTDPITKPPVQDHPTSSKTLHNSNMNPGPSFSPVAFRSVGPMTSWYVRLTEIENPISSKLHGSASPNAASHGRQLL